jgi:hypothetical protein
MKKRNQYIFKQVSAVLILVVFVIIQSRQSLFSVEDQLTTIYRNIAQPAAWRGATFFSKEFADLVAFLNKEIPLNATVVLPPRGVGFVPLTHTQYMQYFLYPRKIINCNSNYQGCIQGFLDEVNAYVVIAEAGQFSDFLAELPRDLSQPNRRWDGCLMVGAFLRWSVVCWWVAAGDFSA